MLPNDVFKRPGPHRAYETDAERVARLREALDVLEELGYAEPLSRLLGTPEADLLRGSLGDQIGYWAPTGPNFGLRRYGPMFERAGLDVAWGEPLFRERDPRVAPVSMFWADHRPWLPQHVAPAGEVVAQLDALRDPDAAAWNTLREEIGEPDPDDVDPVSADALIAQWRGACLAELDACRAHAVEIARRGGLVISWFDEQGWL